jgi:hypothetical protein
VRLDHAKSENPPSPPFKLRHPVHPGSNAHSTEPEMMQLRSPIDCMVKTGGAVNRSSLNLIWMLCHWTGWNKSMVAHSDVQDRYERETCLARTLFTPTLCIYLLTYLRSWALLEKLPIVQPLKNFPAFYGTRSFIECSDFMDKNLLTLPFHKCY